MGSRSVRLGFLASIVVIIAVVLVALVLANGQFGSFKCCAMQPRHMQRILLLKAAAKGSGARGEDRVIACRGEAAITVWALKNTRLSLICRYEHDS